MDYQNIIIASAVTVIILTCILICIIVSRKKRCRCCSWSGDDDGNLIIDHESSLGSCSPVSRRRTNDAVTTEALPSSSNFTIENIEPEARKKYYRPTYANYAHRSSSLSSHVSDEVTSQPRQTGLPSGSRAPVVSLISNNVYHNSEYNYHREQCRVTVVNDSRPTDHYNSGPSSTRYNLSSRNPSTSTNKLTPTSIRNPNSCRVLGENCINRNKIRKPWNQRKQLLGRKATLLRQPSSNDDQLKNTKSLIIAVDATPFHIGAYCIDPFQEMVHYYSVSSSKMPWTLNDKKVNGNSSEFEMKNLMCALLIWADLMATYKFVRIYTDNSAIKGTKSPYAKRIHRFLHHLGNCENAVVLNPSEIFLHSKTDQEKFQKYIIPADHLSRRREDDFAKHFYQSNLTIRNFKRINFWRVKRPVAKWTRQTCHKCGFYIERSGSFKI
ncbi:uncharacterized protein LOC110845754 isoform X1 [Folsomia candida]|uniref:uncharacterized protein LOC110845754 isoform X1 n=2 Tax=Folsomia candida TaxID=158441 RepID=UPI001604A4CF|nr:uncharacterized protein LOC110845754 isoform X1 [Folsomia candida]